MKHRVEKIKQKLLENPELIDRFEGILDIIENKDGNFNTADETEEKTQEELQKLGNELLSQWAEKSVQEHSSNLEKSEEYRKSRKKKSIGTVHTVK